MKNNFNSEESVQNIVIKQLEKKYNQDFIHLENTKKNIEKYPLKKVYTGYFAPKNNPKQTFFVWISDKNSMKDNFAQYYILEDAKKEIAKLVDTNETSLNKLSLAPKGTEEIIDSNISLEEYNNEYNPTYEIEVNVIQGLSEEDNVLAIQKIMNNLYDNITNFTIGVKLEGTKQCYYSEAFYKDTNRRPKNTIEEIKNTIKDQTENNELLEESSTN